MNAEECAIMQNSPQKYFPKKDLREVWNNYTNDNSKKNGPKEKSTWQKAVNIASWVSLIPGDLTADFQIPVKYFHHFPRLFFIIYHSIYLKIQRKAADVHVRCSVTQYSVIHDHALAV